MPFVQRSKILMPQIYSALSGILAVLSDKLSPEIGSSGGSSFTALQIIFNKFGVVSLTWLYLTVINPPFLHDKV